MITFHIRKILFLSFLVLPFSLNAALFGALPTTPGGTDYQAIYDDQANLSWSTNLLMSGTSRDWNQSVAWASTLDIGGTTDWRLPFMVQPDANCSISTSTFTWGSNCTLSEMGNFFDNILGGDTPNTNRDYFSDIDQAITSNASFWSSETVPLPDYAFIYTLTENSGLYVELGDFNEKFRTLYYSWVVHDGFVGDFSDLVALSGATTIPPSPTPTIVPIPGAFWLFGSGIFGLIALAKRRKVCS